MKRLMCSIYQQLLLVLLRQQGTIKMYKSIQLQVHSGLPRVLTG